MTILNLTQHHATPDQLSAGVVDVDGNERSSLLQALNFTRLPSGRDVDEAAHLVASIAARWFLERDRRLLRQEWEAGSQNCPGLSFGSAIDVAEALHSRTAMIGGAPFLMEPLAIALRKHGIRPVYAFSVRESVEETLPDGSVRKTAVFRHEGFVS